MHPHLHLFVAGPSGSGKSTLAQLAAERLGLPVLCLDDAFIARPRRYVDTPGGRVRNYEDPLCYDGPGVARQAGDTHSGAVLEGFCLFRYPEIMALAGPKFYLDVPFPVCLARRQARRPQRPSDTSFALIGEQLTDEHVAPQRSLEGVTVLDGSAPLADNLEIVLAAYRRARNPSS